MPLQAGNRSRAAHGIGSVCGGFWARFLGLGLGRGELEEEEDQDAPVCLLSSFLRGLTVCLSPTCLPIIPTMAADATGMRRTRVLVTTW